MKRFKQFISEQVVLQEGGLAVKSSSRINQDNVADTLADIYKNLLPKLGIKKEDTANLGSTGKKKSGDSSGDIDLAVRIGAFLKGNIKTSQDIEKHITKIAGSYTTDFKPMWGMGLLSMAWPIANTDGQQEGKVVQLDIMLVDSLEFASWSYYSPAWNESEWKGLYANEIRYAIAKLMNYKTIERALDKEGIETDAEWERNFFILGKGIFKGTQSRKGKKGLTKGIKTIEKSLLTNNPTQATIMMYGPKFNPNDVLTFEQNFKIVAKDKNFIHKKIRDSILKMASKGILNKGVPLPDVLKPWS